MMSLGFGMGLPFGTGGGVSYNPLLIPGIDLWVDASNTASITQSSNLISQWNDLGPSSRKFKQAIGASQPTLSGSVVNFPTNTPFMTLFANDGTTPNTITAGGAGTTSTLVVVMQRVSGTGYAVPVLGVGNQYHLSADATASTLSGANTLSEWSLGSYTIDTNKHIYTLSCLEGTGWALSVDSVSKAITSARSDAPPIAQLGIGDASAANWNLCELLHFSTTPLGANQAPLEAYLQAKWGTP